jgi:hypothetical protein
VRTGVEISSSREITDSERTRKGGKEGGKGRGEVGASMSNTDLENQVLHGGCL